MAEKTLEQRLALLEREAADNKARAEKAESRLDAKDRELKQTRAAFSDHKAATARHMGALNSMQDLVELRRNGSNPYELGDDEGPRERKERIMKETVRTKDGRRHYYIEKRALVSENGGPPISYEGDQFISVPQDHVPSITWLPVEVAGKDKEGKLHFAVKGQLKKQEAVDPGDELADDGSPLTNTQINEQRAAGQAKNARLGPGSPTPPAQRPSDQTVG